MADPVFETRAELTKWASARAKDTWPYDSATMMDRLEEIKRVTLAHAHLPFEDA